VEKKPAPTGGESRKDDEEQKLLKKRRALRTARACGPAPTMQISKALTGCGPVGPETSLVAARSQLQPQQPPGPVVSGPAGGSMALLVSVQDLGRTCVPPRSPSVLTIFSHVPRKKLANLHTQSTVFPSARLNRMRMVVIRLARRFWSPGIATRDRGVLVCMPVLLMSGKAFPAGRPSDSFLNGAKTVLLPRFSQFRPRPL